MPRFVILRHDFPAAIGRATHFDLMLEQGGVLSTWACDSLPQPDSSALADQLPDHRLAYLTYEGEISGGRGSVTRVASGEYERLQESPDYIQVRLTSGSILGVLTITRGEGENAHRWCVSLAPAAPLSG